jgi:hypothetical protein
VSSLGKFEEKNNKNKDKNKESNNNFGKDFNNEPFIP